MKNVLIIAIALFFLGMFTWFYWVSQKDLRVSESRENTQINVNNTIIMKIESTAFKNNGAIPTKYTCDGENIHPPLDISGVPEGAKTLALIMEDPDVPKNIRADGTWIHWVVFNISTSTTSIKEGEKANGIYGAGTSGTSEYVGPCPPNGEHHYNFYLYALDTELSLRSGAIKEDILKEMEGHILSESRLTGLYASN